MSITGDDVKAIMQTSLSVEAIEPFLGMATRLVAARLTGQYDADTLDDITKNLAAHFACLQDPRLKSESVEGADVTYFMTSTIGEGLASSPYGQTVQVLEYKGILSRHKGTVDIEAF